MKRQNIKYAMSIFILFILCCTFIALEISQDVAYALDKGLANETIVIENGLISVDLRGVTINQFVTKLNEEIDLKFNVDKSLSQEKLYAQFEKISLHEGLMKIFYGINYILYFLKNGELSQVILLSKKKGYDAKGLPASLKRRRSLNKSRISTAQRRKYVESQRAKRRSHSPILKPPPLPGDSERLDRRKRLKPNLP